MSSVADEARTKRRREAAAQRAAEDELIARHADVLERNGRHYYTGATLQATGRGTFDWSMPYDPRSTRQFGSGEAPSARDAIEAVLHMLTT
jgi:hypothetical protein